MMERLLTESLVRWQTSPRRKPLIVRGARQVGKTWAITDFGNTHFDVLHAVDLERDRGLHRLFEGDLDALRILTELEVVLGRRITPGADLLFLDEIQACPRALIALRYFREQVPDLHVIAAGSLLEFALGANAFPVGRVQFLTVFPMTFAEFLKATGDEVAADVVSGGLRPQPDATHAHLLERLRRYLFVGGMPEAVAVYAASGSLQEAFAVHDELAIAYREDFGKYAGRADKDCLDAVLGGIAQNVGRQVKYARLAAGFDNRAIKQSFDLLARAQVVRPVRAASPAGVPLAATASQKRFKAIMVDLGLLRRLSGLRADVEYARSDLLAVYNGALAEQFAGQELLAAGAGDRELYYWARDERGSSAEVDYLIDGPGRPVPIEVKAGPAGRLRSMHMLLADHRAAAPGIVLSETGLSVLPRQTLAFVPLYFAAAVARADLDDQLNALGIEGS
jgi:predicted AAA+ superfamily ATPase